MIARVHLRRFKRFIDRELALRPFTVLTGTNGSGKTSVIHALLLAREAVMTTSDGVRLNGPHGLQLGEAADVLHHDADPSEGFEVEVVECDGASYHWRFATPDDRTLVLDVSERPSVPPASFAAQSRDFAYLGADRLGPQDTLPAAPWAHRSLGVGVRGEYVAHVLAVLDRHPVPTHRCRPDVTPKRLQHQVEGWMTAIARPLQVRAEWFPRSTVTQLQYKTPGARNEWVRPPNMGFGVSTALPVIVAGLIVPTGGLLIVENPEIHLHPAGQSAIGQFLAQVAADGVQVLVETHSDHVVNGMRRAVAEGKLPAKDALVHYFGEAVTEITVNERGKLSEWPDGFFDQLDQDLGAIARRSRKR